MGLTKYIEENGLEGEPAGLAVLAAAESANANIPSEHQDEAGLYIMSPRRLSTIVETIGVQETDELENVRSKILFALRATRGGRYPLFDKEESLQNLRITKEEAERALTLEAIREAKELAPHKSNAQIIQEQKETTQESLLKFLDANERKALEKTLRELLNWVEH